MTPRPDVAVIEDISSLEDAVAHFRDTGYSRVPVYHDHIDNIVGTLNIKDLFNAYTAGNHRAFVKTLMYDVYCVPESKKIDDLLRELQLRHMHMAIVLDEFGGVSGVVSLRTSLKSWSATSWMSRTSTRLPTSLRSVKALHGGCPGTCYPAH
ncbi:MAG: CBS domain-containing protein [Methanocorpusculum sp.]|nr:CBS domain-containing protein [Methanocorpusculum sp.]